MNFASVARMGTSSGRFQARQETWSAEVDQLAAGVEGGGRRVFNLVMDTILRSLTPVQRAL